MHSKNELLFTRKAPERLINLPWPDKMASDNMKDNFLYLALVPSGGLLPHIKQSSMWIVPVETITSPVALIQPETPLYKHGTRGCAARHQHLPKPDGAFYYVQGRTSHTAWTSSQRTKYVSYVSRPCCLCTLVYCIISTPHKYIYVHVGIWPRELPLAVPYYMQKV